MRLFLKPLVLAICVTGCMGCSYLVQASSIENEIIVTATRAETPLDKVAPNFSVLNAQALSKTGAEHVEQLLSQVSGVNYQRGDGQESLPGLRSSVLTGAGACGSVLVMEEGIPVRGPAFCNVNELFDTHFEQASQIEIAKGASTPFYGSNALTGMVNVVLPVVPKKSYGLEVGEDNYVRFKGSLPYSGDNASGGFWFTVTDTDSFRQDAGYSQQKLSWRQLSQIDEWKIKAGLSATHLEQDTAGFITGKDSYLDRELASTNANPEAFRDSRSLRAWAKLSRKLNSGATMQLTPYVRATDMDFRLHFLPGKPLERNSQNGIGWQSVFSSKLNDQVDWMLGFDADFSKGDLQQIQELPTQGSAFLQETIPSGVQYDYEVNARQFALFGQVQMQLQEKLSLAFGVRAEHLEYDYDNRALSGRTRDDGSECSFGGCRYSRPADQSNSFSNVSPSLSARYELSERVNLFASYAESFRAPQASELYRLQRQQQIAELDNVKARNSEIGMTYRTDRTQFALSLYDLIQENVIIRDSDFFNVDGNKIKSRGMEASFEYSINESLSIQAAVTIAEQKYASDQLSAGINVNANEVDTSPDKLVNVSLDWAANEALSVQLQANHVGQYYLEPENERIYPGHTIWHLRSEYQITPRLSLNARVLSVSDERYAARADFTSFTGERYFPGNPRSFYLGFSYHLAN